MRLLALLVLGFGFLIPPAGCRPRSTPPGADTTSASDGQMSFVSLRWKEGLRLLFVDDLKGDHASRGSGSTESSVYTQVGSAGPANGARCDWRLETVDGKAARLTINSKAYDLTKGALFVAKANGDEFSIHQLQRDLSTLPAEPLECQAALKRDAELMKLLGISGPGE